LKGAKGGGGCKSKSTTQTQKRKTKNATKEAKQNKTKQRQEGETKSKKNKDPAPAVACPSSSWLFVVASFSSVGSGRSVRPVHSNPPHTPRGLHNPPPCPAVGCVSVALFLSSPVCLLRSLALPSVRPSVRPSLPLSCTHKAPLSSFSRPLCCFVVGAPSSVKPRSGPTDCTAALCLTFLCAFPRLSASSLLLLSIYSHDCDCTKGSHEEKW
jgi:hypothetical protein